MILNLLEGDLHIYIKIANLDFLGFHLHEHEKAMISL